MLEDNTRTHEVGRTQCILAACRSLASRDSFNSRGTLVCERVRHGSLRHVIFNELKLMALPYTCGNSSFNDEERWC